MAEIHEQLVKDGGYKSRKLWLAFFSIAIIFAGGVCASFWPGFSAIYTTFVNGVEVIAAAYFTGNVANKFVATKTRRKKPSKPIEQAPEE